MSWNQIAFAERLAESLSQRDWEQKYLAERIQISDDRITNWKRNRSEPSLNDIVVAAEALDVRPAWLAFDDGYEPMDDEEREIADLVRKMDDTDRATLRAFLASITAGKETSARGGKRSKPSVSTSDAPGSEPSEYQPLRLPEIQLNAFLDWMMGEVERMPLERPLTIACYEIARRLSRDNVPRASAETLGESASSEGTREKDKPSGDTSSPPTSHRTEDRPKKGRPKHRPSDKPPKP